MEYRSSSSRTRAGGLRFASSLLAELRFLDLSVSALRQCIAKDHVGGHHEALEPCTALALDRGRVEHDPGFEHDERLDRLAEHLVGHADHGDLAYARDIEDRGLDFLGRDLLAARLDDVVHARDE